MITSVLYAENMTKSSKELPYTFESKYVLKTIQGCRNESQFETNY